MLARLGFHTLLGFVLSKLRIKSGSIKLVDWKIVGQTTTFVVALSICTKCQNLIVEPLFFKVEPEILQNFKVICVQKCELQIGHLLMEGKNLLSPVAALQSR